jgi:two-component system phosphate regulon response regulator PhoB
VLPDLVLLDWMLPGQSGCAGQALARPTRTRELPIIMLTARAEEADKVAWAGRRRRRLPDQAFFTKELMARIRAVLRRKAPQALDAAVEVAGLRLDPSTRRVARGEPRSRSARPSSACCTFS